MTNAAGPAAQPNALYGDAGGFSAAPRKANGEVDWLSLYLGFFAMVVGQFMAMLDIQIVASSLPQIQAGISASADEVSWIQSAYLIPEVVMIPLSGYLSRLWGTQRVFMVSCAGFVVMSVLTGLSSNIDTMIVTRALQGFIGGAMIPTVFAIAFTAFPLERRVTATTIMGLIVTLAPTIGPTLGGHLTELLSWRWLFFINIVPGILVLVLVGRYGNFDRGDPSLAQGFDWFGLAAMAIFLMSMEVVLQDGAKNNWVADDKILWLTVVTVISGVVFVWRQLSYWQPIMQLKVFADRNFTIGICINFANGATIFGGTFLIPLFLGRVQQFSSAQVGTTMLVSGVTMMMVAPIAGRVVRRYDPRISMVLGLLIAAIGVWPGHAITKDWGFWNFAWLQALRSFGVMLAMIGSQMLAMSTLAPQLIKSASGILNLARNTGGAVGLAVLSSALSSQTAEHMNDLTSRVSIASTQAQGMLAGLSLRMAGLGVPDPQGAARKAFDFMIAQDATVLAFGDGFAMLAVGCVAAACVSLLAKPGAIAMMPPPMKDAH
jgi:DHA2 family multidrug resistance protein